MTETPDLSPLLEPPVSYRCSKCHRVIKSTVIWIDGHPYGSTCADNILALLPVVSGPVVPGRRPPARRKAPKRGR